ncbi:hypothetical protein BHM03_00007281 [Ensete ventricosum]|uniref:Dual specificity protein phosphatase DSP8 n=2 Tax=Ensete ventricosum TaxID=4639 RepID=A0A445MC35_ENSVE|nr:hypothetical protein BHM03_00007281 [Ensete ventricosum]
MRITELEDGGSDDSFDFGVREIVPAKAKRAIVGAGARILFYPTLLYNVFRNKIQAEFRWWDEIDEFLLLGAVPFPKDVPLLHQLGVQGVVTLNEPYETLVPSSLYQATALEYVRSRRSRVLLAPSQWQSNMQNGFYLTTIAGSSRFQAVQDFSKRKLQYYPVVKSSAVAALFPAGDAVLITEADLEGYDTGGVASKELSIITSCRFGRAMPVVVARLSCLLSALRSTGGCPTVASQLPPQITTC